MVTASNTSLFNLNKFSCYVVAHADDWQLFMQPHIKNDLLDPGCKTIIIITTAGDAGMGEKFWRAREEGSRSSTRIVLAAFGPITESEGMRSINGHLVSYWTANNTITYFLRLPDGNLNGKGFKENRFESLTRFASREIDTMTSVDQANIYADWSSFTSTIESIVQIESRAIANKWIHYLNPDVTVNINDHPDHLATGLAIQSMPIIRTLNQSLFVGYCSRLANRRQTPNDLFWKTSMFAAYEKAVYDYCGYSTLKENPELYACWGCNHADVQVITSGQKPKVTKSE